MTASTYGPALDRIKRQLPGVSPILATELHDRALPNYPTLTYGEYADDQVARLADLDREQLIGELILARSRAGRAEAALTAVAAVLDEKAGK